MTSDNGLTEIVNEPRFCSSDFPGGGSMLWRSGLLGGLFVFSGTIVGASSRGMVFWLSVLIVVIGLYDLIFVFRARNKFGSVVVRESRVTVTQDGDVYDLDWSEVDYCSSLRFQPLLGALTPTVYQLTSRRRALETYFVPQRLWLVHTQGRSTRL